MARTPHVIAIIIMTIVTSLSAIGCRVREERWEVEKLMITISTMLINIRMKSGLFVQIGCFQGFDW